MPLKHTTDAKFADIIGLKLKTAKDIIQRMYLADYDALIQAVEIENIPRIHKLYKKYKITKTKDEQTKIEVNDFFQKQLEKLHDYKEALTLTSDYFGLRGEDVEEFIEGRMKENSNGKNLKNNFDISVNEALEKITSIFKTKTTPENINIVSNLNEIQAEELLYRLPKTESTIVSKILKLNPKKLMQAHAKISGFNTIAEEYNMSLTEMTDKLISYYLVNITEQKLKKARYAKLRRNRKNDPYYNKKIGTVGREGFDQDKKLDPDNKITHTVYGTVDLTENNEKKSNLLIEDILNGLNKLR